MASWIAHQTAACPNTWFTGTVLVGNEMNSSEILLLNSFSGVSLLSPDWYCSVLAGYLLSSGHVPGTGFGNSFLVVSNLVGRLFRRLVLTDSTGTSLLRQSSSHIFVVYSCKFTFNRSMIIFNRFIDIFVRLLFRLLSCRRRNLLNSFKSFHNQGMILRRFTLIVEIRPSLLLQFYYQYLRISLFS